MKHLPGYTGHIPEEIPVEEGIGHSAPRSQIPGYKGYIPSIKSENMFGETYGKTTFKVADGGFVRGRDPDPKDKFVSVSREQFIDLSTVTEKTATEMLGLQPKSATNTVVVPISALNAFWGIQSDDLGDATNAFYAGQEDEAAEDEFEASKLKFFGKMQTEKPVKLGEPVPGYTGVSRRVVADNIFGVTYGNSRKAAKEDLKEQKMDKADVLKQRAVFVPEYRR